MGKLKTKIRISDILTAIGAAAIILLEIYRPTFSTDEAVNGIIMTIISRFIGSLVFIPLAVRCRYNVFGFAPQRRIEAVLSTIPPLLVVVNNFPFLGLIRGDIALTRGGYVLWLFVLQSVLIGTFEEFAFRAVLFPMVLEKRRDTKKKIFWATVVSSAVFGLIHLFNLLEGSSVGATLLQIGYSFLIGGMCSIVLLKTGNIFICVILHAVFDFGGFFVPTVAAGMLWDTPTVIITAVLGVLTLAHMLVVLHRIEPEDIQYIYNNQKNAA